MSGGNVYDQHTTVRQFVPDDTVFVRNFGEGDTWLAETIVNAPGPRSYNVKLSDDMQSCQTSC